MDLFLRLLYLLLSIHSIIGKPSTPTLTVKNAMVEGKEVEFKCKAQLVNPPPNITSLVIEYGFFEGQSQVRSFAVGDVYSKSYTRSQTGTKVTCRARDISKELSAFSNIIKLLINYPPDPITIKPDVEVYRLNKSSPLVGPITGSSDCSPACKVSWQVGARTFKDNPLPLMAITANTRLVCVATNSLGFVNKAVQVQFPPDAPSEVACIDRGDNWVRLRGRSEEHNLLVEMSRDIDKPLFAAVPDRTQTFVGDVFDMTINGLSEDDDLLFRVTAVSDVGRSASAITVCMVVTRNVTIEAGDPSTGPSFGLGVLAGVFLALGVCGLVLLTVGVVCKRRQVLNHKAEVTEDRPRDVDSERTGPEGVETQQSTTSGDYAGLDDGTRAGPSHYEPLNNCTYENQMFRQKSKEDIYVNG